MWYDDDGKLASRFPSRILIQADIGRRVEPYRRSLSLFDCRVRRDERRLTGRVRRVEPYRRKLSLPNPT